MKCLEVQNDIPEYLEDMVPEEKRTAIHLHLAGCSACRDHAARLSSFSGDLKKLAQVPVPFDLANAVKEGLSRKPAAPSFDGLKNTAVFALVAACLFGVFRTVSEDKKRAETAKLEEKTRIEDQQAAAILEKLRQTEANLQRGSGSRARLKVASLEPFHWQLKFANPSEREFFYAQLKRINPKETFHADAFLAFSMDQTHLKDLIGMIEKSPATVVEEPKIDLKSLPQSEAPLQITLLMGTQGTRDPFSWRYLRFLRHDGYLFTRRLHELGFTFLAEVPHFIVLRVSASEYETLKFEMGNTLGLEFVRGNNADSFLKNSPESFPVILFFQEG